MLSKDDFGNHDNRDFSKDASGCICRESQVNLKEFDMNKGELVDAVAEKASVTKKQADAVLSAALETIIEAVSSGDKVTLVGFGSFESRERKAREGRNPKTNEKMEIPATKVPAFSAGKLFRERVAPPKAEKA
jgi:DNA-binding protein HU-beta